MNVGEHQLAWPTAQERIIGAIELVWRRGETPLIQNRRVNCEDPPNRHSAGYSKG